MTPKLTPKQKAFADNYIKNGGNASDAARKAGYKQPEIQGYENIRKPNIATYIAERQAEIDKLNGTDIMSLADIQKRRSQIASGTLKDSFGFTPAFTEQLKAMSDLEKTLAIKEKKEATFASS